MENNLVGRIAPAAMLNEAYTWMVTVSVGGQRRRRRGGRCHRGPAAAACRGRSSSPAAVLAVAALVAAVPRGPIARADRRAADRLRRAMAAEAA